MRKLGEQWQPCPVGGVLVSVAEPRQRAGRRAAGDDRGRDRRKAGQAARDTAEACPARRRPDIIKSSVRTSTPLRYANSTPPAVIVRVGNSSTRLSGSVTHS